MRLKLIRLPKLRLPTKRLLRLLNPQRLKATTLLPKTTQERKVSGLKDWGI